MPKRTEKATVLPTAPRPEPIPSTRLAALKVALSAIDFGFTVFFTSEHNECIKYYQGAVKQQEFPQK